MPKSSPPGEWPSSLPHFHVQYSGLCGRQPTPLATATAMRGMPATAVWLLVLSVSAPRALDMLLLLQTGLLANPAKRFLSYLKWPTGLDKIWVSHFAFSYSVCGGGGGAVVLQKAHKLECFAMAHPIQYRARKTHFGAQVNLVIAFLLLNCSACSLVVRSVNPRHSPICWEE